MSHVIAHRGASADRPENTLEAFEEAARQGADGVELDVRPTLDGVLAVIHDAFLPDGRAVSETPSTQLPSTVPRLEDAIEACGSMTVNVEIKNMEGEPGFDRSGWLAGATVEAASRTTSAGGVLISSFDPDVLDAVRAVPAAPPTALLVLSVHEPRDALQAALNAGHVAVNPWDHLVDSRLVERAAEEGLALNVWTVDDPDRIRQLAAWNVAAIITNRPAAARRAMRAGDGSAGGD